MASGKGNQRADDVLDWTLDGTPPTQPGGTNALRIALTMTTDPSASSAATGLTAGSGYTAGGDLIVFGAASSQTRTGDSSSVIDWTNSSTTWTITGAIIHDAGASHPTAADMIYWDDAFDVTVPNGATLEIAIDGVTVTEA
jgi:hypothetical protein